MNGVLEIWADKVLAMLARMRDIPKSRWEVLADRRRNNRTRNRIASRSRARNRK